MAVSGVLRYLAVRASLILPSVLILYTVVFIILRIIPGDPVLAALGTRYVPEEQLEELRERLGLNKPLYEQYFEYLMGVFRGDLGESMVVQGRAIVDDIKSRFPATLELTVSGFIVAVAIGMVTGLIASLKRGSRIDSAMRIYGILAYTLFIPWIGMMLQLTFGVWLGLLPTGGRLDYRIDLDTVTGLYVLDSLITRNWEALVDSIEHLILPSITLGIVLSGAYTRLVRANMVDVLESDFIKAYRSRGIRERRVILYALRNSFVPIVTMMGLQFAILLGGAVLTETTFSWPGIGTYLIEKVEQRDYTAIQGVVVFYAILVALVNLVVDAIYAIIDPRIRY